MDQQENKQKKKAGNMAIGGGITKLLSKNFSEFDNGKTVKSQ